MSQWVKKIIFVADPLTVYSNMRFSSVRSGVASALRFHNNSSYNNAKSTNWP